MKELRLEAFEHLSWRGVSRPKARIGQRLAWITTQRGMARSSASESSEKEDSRWGIAIEKRSHVGRVAAAGEATPAQIQQENSVLPKFKFARILNFPELEECG